MTTQYSIDFNRKFRSYNEYLNFYREILDADIKNMLVVLRKLRLNNGFYKASTSDFYSHTWLRDNFYCSLPEFEYNKSNYIQTYRTWFDYYIKIEKEYGKFSSLINKGFIEHDWEFPNPRINYDLTEIHNEQWGHIQLDQFGYFLYGVSKGELAGYNIIRGLDDYNIINLILKTMKSIKYTTISENGEWEENKETPRMSTIGVIVSGLKELKKIINNPVIDQLIIDGDISLNGIFPNQTPTRKTDLAQMFLIYPFDYLDMEKSSIVISNIEENLSKQNGVNRYKNDAYYNNGMDASWCFGNFYLGLYYCKIGEKPKARELYQNVINETFSYEIPELFYGGTNTKGDNTPLGWSIAMAIMLANELKK